MAASDEKVKDLKVDLAGSDGSKTIIKSTASRLSVLALAQALAQAAIDVSLLFGTMQCRQAGNGGGRPFAGQEGEDGAERHPRQGNHEQVLGFQGKVDQLMEVVADRDLKIESLETSPGQTPFRCPGLSCTDLFLATFWQVGPAAQKTKNLSWGNEKSPLSLPFFLLPSRASSSLLCPWCDLDGFIASGDL
jgi:hypothetical protein